MSFVRRPSSLAFCLITAGTRESKTSSLISISRLTASGTAQCIFPGPSARATPEPINSTAIHSIPSSDVALLCSTLRCTTTRPTDHLKPPPRPEPFPPLLTSVSEHEPAPGLVSIVARVPRFPSSFDSRFASLARPLAHLSACRLSHDLVSSSAFAPPTSRLISASCPSAPAAVQRRPSSPPVASFSVASSNVPWFVTAGSFALDPSLVQIWASSSTYSSSQHHRHTCTRLAAANGCTRPPHLITSPSPFESFLLDSGFRRTG